MTDSLTQTESKLPWMENSVYVGDNSVSRYCLYTSETQQLSSARRQWSSVWSCYGAAVSQWRADLQHTLATQRLRKMQVVCLSTHGRTDGRKITPSVARTERPSAACRAATNVHTHTHTHTARAIKKLTPQRESERLS